MNKEESGMRERRSLGFEEIKVKGRIMGDETRYSTCRYVATFLLPPWGQALARLSQGALHNLMYLGTYTSRCLPTSRGIEKTSSVPLNTPILMATPKSRVLDLLKVLFIPILQLFHRS